MVLVATSGNIVGSMKTTESSQQLALGSLSADNDSMTWVSVYSTSSSYSELIKYDSANNNYTIYEQTGFSYILQYRDLSTYNWVGLGVTQYISNTTQTCMSNVTGLTVSTTTSGLDDASSSFTIATATGTFYPFSPQLLVPNTSITSTASDMIYNYIVVVESQANSTNQTTSTSQTNGGDDDGLTTEELIAIILGSAFAFVLVIVIAILIIYIHHNTKNRHSTRQETKPETQVECQPEEDLDSQEQFHNIQGNQI